MFDVVIIGAGAAGLAAARKLADARASYVVLEAKPNIGGRAVTDTATFGSAVDLGGHWLHSPALNPFTPLAERYKFHVKHGAEDFRFAQGGQVLSATESAECLAYIDDCFERIVAAGDERVDCIVADLFPFQGKWHDLFEANFLAKQGVPSRNASAQDFARYVWEGDDQPVLDGFGALVARHAQGLDVRTGTPVARIDWSGANGVSVETPQGTLRARVALITASTGVLAAEAIRFTPSLPDWKLAAIADLPLGSCNKIILGFDRNAFGGMSDVMLMPDLGPDRSVELVVREGGRDIVTAMFNGPFAKELAAQGAAEGRAFTLDVLAGLFGSSIRDAVLEKMVVADWDHDPWIRGCYAAANLGRAEARAVLGRPVEGRLFFAGEAIHDRYMGDIQGAHLSGEAAAETALDVIRRN
jgi:monoamine oxidase